MAAQYATLDDVRARCPWHMKRVTDSSDIDEDDVQKWLDDGEHLLNGTLRAAKLSAPYTAAGAQAILREVLLDFVEGRLRRAFVSGGAEPGNEDGKDYLDAFKSTLKEILTHPAVWGAKLDDAGSAPSAALMPRSYPTDNEDGLSIANGDFDAEWTKGMDL